VRKPLQSGYTSMFICSSFSRAGLLFAMNGDSYDYYDFQDDIRKFVFQCGCVRQWLKKECPCLILLMSS
ncbi:MAG: hypothetical protein LBN33_11240, partial [Desulfovibrio sp.]|nr:hypothetical protein [Desulfovibrio sp.]